MLSRHFSSLTLGAFLTAALATTACVSTQNDPSAAVSSAKPFAFDAKTHAIGSTAEWQQAKLILSHSPEDELFYGLLQPDAALFNYGFSQEGAVAEHRHYREQLAAAGAEVITLTEVLRAAPQEELQALAQQFFTLDLCKVLDHKGLPSTLADYIHKQHINRHNCAERGAFPIAATLSQDQLVRTILEQPYITLKPDDKNTGVYPEYRLDPLTNLYFMRDQMITTPKGVVISKMNSMQRAPETRLVRFVLQRLGIEPIYEVQGEGRLEGGDYIPAGKVEFIGQGLRTNAEAIRQLLKQRVFAADQVIVVKDQKSKQDEMHLDTYFNVIDHDLAVLGEVRIPGKTSAAMLLYADVYSKNADGSYRKTRSDVEFYTLLTQDLGYTVIPVSADDQYNEYGTNFLTVKGRNIIAVKGASPAYVDAMRKNNVNVNFLDFNNLRGGWGAAHCTTQVISREK